MTYISQYKKDMDVAYDQIEKAINNAWNAPEYKTIQALNALLLLMDSMYRMIAEIGDEINGTNK